MECLYDHRQLDTDARCIGHVEFLWYVNCVYLPGCFHSCYEGTSLIWYGNIPGELSGNSTTATWVIDDNPAQHFTLKGHGVDATTVYNQKFFETPVYPLGPHRLTVTYNGDSSKTPLVLGKIVIHNDTAVPSTSTSTTSSTHATSNQTPAIVGGVIGGVACLLIVTLLVLYRRRQKKTTRVAATQVTPYNPGAPSRLPEKSSNFLLFRSRTTPGSGLSSVETATHPFGSPTIGDGQHSPNPSDSYVSDSTIQVAGPSSVVHRDSGARFAQGMPGPPTDIPPAYTSA